MYNFHFSTTKVMRNIRIHIKNIEALGFIYIMYTCNTCREYYVNISYVGHLYLMSNMH